MNLLGPHPLRRVGILAVAGGLAGAAFVVVPQHLRHGHGCDRRPEDNQIVMLAGEDINPGRRRHELIKEWNDAHRSGPTVKLIEISGGSNSEYGEMLASQQLGSCDYDVLSLDVVWVPDFIRSGYLEDFPATEFTSEGFLPGPWRTGTGGDGRQYGIPFSSDVGLLFYLKDLKRPPRSWRELRDVTIEHLRRRSGVKPKAGIVTQLANYEGLTVNGMEAIWAAGGTLRVAKQRILLDQAAVSGLQRLVDETTTTVIYKKSTEYQETESLKAFIQNRILTMRNWPYALSVLNADPVMRGKVDVTELFDPPPGAMPGSAVLGGQDLVISRNALHKDKARELVRFLTHPSRQCRLFTQGGYVPVRTEVYDENNRTGTRCSELWGPQAEGDAENADAVDAKHLRKLAGVLEKALHQARPRPAVPDYPAFSRAFHRYLHDAIVGSEKVSKPELERLLTVCSGWTPAPKECP